MNKVSTLLSPWGLVREYNDMLLLIVLPPGYSEGIQKSIRRGLLTLENQWAKPFRFIAVLAVLSAFIIPVPLFSLLIAITFFAIPAYVSSVLHKHEVEGSVKALLPKTLKGMGDSFSSSSEEGKPELAVTVFDTMTTMISAAAQEELPEETAKELHLYLYHKLQSIMGQEAWNVKDAAATCQSIAFLLDEAGVDAVQYVHPDDLKQ